MKSFFNYFLTMSLTLISYSVFAQADSLCYDIIEEVATATFEAKPEIGLLQNIYDEQMRIFQMECGIPHDLEATKTQFSSAYNCLQANWIVRNVTNSPGLLSGSESRSLRSQVFTFLFSIEYSTLGDFSSDQDFMTKLQDSKSRININNNNITHEDNQILLEVMDYFSLKANCESVIHSLF